MSVTLPIAQICGDQKHNNQSSNAKENPSVSFALNLARCDGGVNNTNLTPWTPTFQNLVEELRNPTIGDKDGSYFLRCQGTKRNNADTSDKAYILILDGDSRIDEHGKVKSGAPNPATVSKVLTKMGVSHLIYSSFSNGITRKELQKKGIDSGGAYHKYRVLIPCIYSPEQLPALLDYLFAKLHKSRVMLAPVNENKTWAQPWYFPRVPDDIDRILLFELYHHEGKILDAESIYKIWLKSQPTQPEPTTPNPRIPLKSESIKGSRNPIEEFNQAHSVHEVLVRNGYTQKGDRYLRPNSASKIPGVVILRNCADGVERAFSHGGDALNDGYAHDAFDIYQLLECEGDFVKALNWNPELTKQNQRLFMKEQGQKGVAEQLIEMSSNAPSVAPVKKPTHTLDVENKYCPVDLLQHLPSTHLLKRLSKQVSAVTQLPVSTVFIMGLAVFSSVALRAHRVLYQDGKPLPIGLFVVAEQPSGTGKSRCLNVFQQPFVKALKDATKSIDRKRVAENLKDDSVGLVRRPHLFITNATSEGLEKTLDVTNGCFSAVSSEQGLFDSLLGLSYNTGANNNDLVLNGFDGGYVSSCRVTRQGYSGEVIGSVVCFAQQGSIEKVLNSSNGTGLSERFIMVAEPHTLGKRDHTQLPIEDENLNERYSEKCSFAKDILENPKAFSNFTNLRISESGHTHIAEYRNKIEPHLADGGKFSHISLRGAASKINMQIMKIAANLHLLSESAANETIADEYVITAIGIANELLEANLKLCVTKDIIGANAEFRAVLNYLTSNNGMKSKRDILNSLRKTKPFKDFTGNKSNLIKETLHKMVKQGLLTKLGEGSKFMYSLAQ